MFPFSQRRDFTTAIDPLSFYLFFHRFYLFPKILPLDREDMDEPYLNVSVGEQMNRNTTIYMSYLQKKLAQFRRRTSHVPYPVVSSYLAAVRCPNQFFRSSGLQPVMGS